VKKFLLRGASFWAIGLALLVGVNHLYVNTNGYKSLDETFKFYLMPDGIQVANFGSSHGAYGFDYRGLEGITGFNFGLPGQSLHYDLELLKRYGDRLAEGCTVLIPVSYFSFDQKKDSYNQRLIYYRLLDFKAVNNHRWEEYVRLRLLPILSASFNAKFLLKDKKDISFNIYWMYDLLNVHYAPDDIEGYRQNAKRHLEYFQAITGQGENEAYNTKCLEEMIEYCRENGFRPVLLTMPFTRYYNEMFGEEFHREFRAKIKRLCEKHGVPYYDYSQDPRITENLEFFMDSNHLGPEGSKAFTRMVLSDLGLI